ncbi:MAG: lipopolysaccharide biosynthesis protein [Proteobacteria bacterium]|nr:lipopolysaccharide biosynthesis protein [Pseudomonadota bacterium]
MTDKARASVQDDWSDGEDEGISLAELISMLAARKKLIAAATIAAGVLAFGVASLLPKWYTASAVILPPQQQQSSAAAAISQLGALAGLAGGLANVKSPADQYVALMQSTTVSDRLIDQFKLQSVYDKEYRQDTRKKLKENVRINVGKKDGLITVDVDDREPQRAAAMANAYVDQLRQMTNSLAVSEAQQRRMFFEQQLAQTKERLAKAQNALEESGISQGALKVEPKTAAESYARLRAQATAAEVKLQTLRRMLAENTPEVMQQQAALAALREQVARAERQDDGRGGSDYIDKYREFKYQEALFDIFVKQYELAKVDESREGALIQVVDAAQPPELKAGPKRGLIAVAAALLALLASCVVVVVAGLRRLSLEPRAVA